MKTNGLTRVVVADGRAAPFAKATFDRVLVDAPCSGLGALRRRADARWRIREGDVSRLSALQVELVEMAVRLLKPGGVFVYSVCTLTRAESLATDEYLAAQYPRLQPLAPPGAPWRPWGRGGLLLPQAAGTDGMTILRLRFQLDG
jgi:16S rRNA (cytosine967-C5)-methyltransferase